MFRAPEMIERRLIRIGRFEVYHRRDISSPRWSTESWLVFVRRDRVKPTD